MTREDSVEHDDMNDANMVRTFGTTTNNENMNHNIQFNKFDSCNQSENKNNRLWSHTS